MYIQGGNIFLVVNAVEYNVGLEYWANFDKKAPLELF